MSDEKKPVVVKGSFRGKAEVALVKGKKDKENNEPEDRRTGPGLRQTS
jgi:hypothetical protein